MHAALGGAADAIHDPHRDGGVRPDCGLFGQHDGVRPVVQRVGNVRGFGTRVGRVAVTIERSICVAVITGLPALLAARMMRFCACGTSSSGISTARSPRATSRPLASSRIDFEVVERFVLFDLGDERHRGPVLREYHRAGVADILRGANEGERDEVDAGVDREGDSLDDRGR